MAGIDINTYTPGSDPVMVKRECRGVDMTDLVASLTGGQHEVVGGVFPWLDPLQRIHDERDPHEG
jgi:hypothetical protein